MAETSAAAAASLGGDGGGRGGRDGRDRGERWSASPLASPPPTKRRKVASEAEASEPKENPAARESSSGILPHYGQGSVVELESEGKASRPKKNPAREMLLESEAEACRPKKNLAWERSSEMLRQYPQGSLVERTAAVILHIHSVFPASPDAPVLYSNQFLDLWACGRALEPWNEKWQQIPLVLHDSDLTEAVQIKLPAAEEEEQVEAEDLTKTITKVLKNHPGPIERLRLDHSVCPGEGLLREWVEDLSCKGVWELVILNLTQPMEMEFPLHRLRSWSMTTLALGFFALDWQGAQTDDLPSLKQLHLAGCRFSGQALSAVVHRLPCLRILTIGGCHVTVGCGAQGLVIDSGTLTKLHLWHCTGSALTVANAPCLDVLVVGITPPAPPASGKEIVSTIDLNSVPALQKLHQLDLHSHNIRIANYGTRCGSSTKVKQRRVIALPSMSNLEVRVHVCMLHHASVLVDILCNLPRLEELVIERLDDLCAPGDNQDCCRAWSLSLVPPCIKQSLEHLILRSYRGGAGEMAFVRRVLATAARLGAVTFYPHSSVSSDSVAAPFEDCPAISKDCKLQLGLLGKTC